MYKLYERIYEKIIKSDSKKEYTPEFIEFLAFLCAGDVECLEILQFFFNEYKKNTPAQKCNTGEIERMYKQGKKYTEIAKLLGLSYNTVRNKLEECDKKDKLFKKLKLDDKYIAHINEDINDCQESLTMNGIIFHSMINSDIKTQGEQCSFECIDSSYESDDAFFEEDCVNDDFNFF